MRWSSLSTFVAVAVLSCTTPAPAQIDSTEPTFVAALRPDSLLVPIAVFDGREWWNPWPVSYEGDERVKKLTVPRTLAEIPPEWLPPGTVIPERWQLQLASGPVVGIRALVPARPVGFSIKEFIGVRTDRTPQNDSADDEIGIAIAGPGELGRFARPSAEQSRAILGPLMPRLRDLARNALAKWRAEQSSDPTPQLSPVGKNAELELGLIRAVNEFQARTYYQLDGETRYRVRAKDPALCEVTVSISGVVIVQAGRAVSDTLLADAVEHDCTGFGVVEHLATVEVHDRFLWIMKMLLEDGYSYFVFDPSAGAEVRLRGSWD